MPESERCAECEGTAIRGPHCLAHLTPLEWDAEMQRLRDGGRLDATRVAVSEERLAALLYGVSQGAGLLWLPTVHFSETRFSGNANFGNVQFSGDAYFGDAQFSGNAYFRDTRFSGDAGFYGTRFCGHAGFEGAQFSERVSFGKAEFSGNAHFRKARFSKEAYFGDARFSSAYFGKARFSGDASFGGAQFSDDVDFLRAEVSGTAGFVKARFSRAAAFNDARLCGSASFNSAQFAGPARFSGTRFEDEAGFGWAQFSDHVGFGSARFCRNAVFHSTRFSGMVDFGPMVVAGTMDCDDAVFDDDVRMEMSASGLTCRRTRFNGRAELSVRWTEVALDDAAFIGRSHLGGAGSSSRLDEEAVGAARAGAFYANRAGGGDQIEAQPRPRLLSLRRASVQNLALWNLDLRACRFVGAHGLDDLRIEADCEFAVPPGPWRTRRRTLAEEHDWRAGRRDPPAAGAPSPWLPPECRPAAWLQDDQQSESLDPGRIESLYRALRKAFEDRKDEPGAGDFYYGEMEMRRQRTPAPAAHWRSMRDRGERIVLTLYWLASGYGMRASRALCCLAATVAVGAVLLAQGGFAGRGPPAGSLAFALESTISLLRAPEARLTTFGEYVQIALRLLGPLFLGLALLALRGRVKR